MSLCDSSWYGFSSRAESVSEIACVTLGYDLSVYAKGMSKAVLSVYIKPEPFIVRHDGRSLMFIRKSSRVGYLDKQAKQVKTSY